MYSKIHTSIVPKENKRTMWVYTTTCFADNIWKVVEIYVGGTGLYPPRDGDCGKVVVGTDVTHGYIICTAVERESLGKFAGRPYRDSAAIGGERAGVTI